MEESLAHEYKMTGDKTELDIEAKNRGPGPGKYLLPTTVGKDTDTSRPRAPSFSFGQKTWSMKERSPGPAYFYSSDLTHKGSSQSNKHTILGRHATKKIEVTPGPGAYNEEKVVPPNEIKAPSYSFGSRSRWRSFDCVPGPDIYDLPTTLGHKVPHRRSAFAASMYGRRDIQSSSYDYAKTPGPAQYSQTDPAVKQHKAPSFSLQGRSQVPKYKTTVPGPGTYNPHQVNLNKPSAPKFSLGVRHSEYVMPILTEVSD